MNLLNGERLRSLSDQKTCRSGFSRDSAPEFNPSFSEALLKTLSDRLNEIVRLVPRTDDGVVSLKSGHTADGKKQGLFPVG